MPDETPVVEVVPAEAPVTAPADPVAPVDQPIEPVVEDKELYDLPDGRKVDAPTLQSEYRSLLSDYTRKSQQLAADPNINNKKTPEAIDYKDPNWVPPSYADIIEIAKQEFRKDLTEEQEQAKIHEQKITSEIDATLAEIKKVDPSVNENKLFEHATKYGFRDLNAAYVNMKDFTSMIKSSQQQAVKNINERAADPVNANPGSGDTITAKTGNYSSAVDYLRSLKS